MTETAEQAQPTEESFVDREKKRIEAEVRARQEQAAQTREEWHEKWSQQDFKGAIRPETVSAFVKLWPTANAQAVEFAAGISNILSVAPEKKAQGVYNIQSKFGGEFAYFNNGQTEFIGLTTKQAKKGPLTEQTADDIALTARARGWKSVKVNGSEAEKDKLWLAAQKYGLAVSNHTPSEAALKAFADYKAGRDSKAEAGMSEDSGSAFLPVKVATAQSTATGQDNNNDDIIDAEFTEIKDEPVADTKFAKKLEGPAKPLLLEGPKNNPPAP